MSNSVLALEHSLVKVPYETLSKQFRNNQKLIEKEAQVAQNAIGELTTKAKKGQVDATAAGAVLDNVVKRLQTAKRKIEEGLNEEAAQMHRCKLRLDHICEDEAEKSYEWNNIRLDRILVDYLLREGLYESAAELARDSGIENLVDIQVFVDARKVEEALTRHDCSEALAWCAENRSKLRKIQSTFEFNLRVQEFIELAREGRGLDAITHARKFLAPNAETNMPEIQHAMAALAFSPATSCSAYKGLFAETRWHDLRTQFRHDNYLVHSFSTHSLLSIVLQAGLSAFKTRMCYQPENTAVNCPVCTPLMSKLAEPLPFSHRIHSSLVCRLSGDVINDHNPPMVLPNGYVYGQGALEDMAAKNDGWVTCPRTGARFKYAELKKVFVM